jgi:hypothetical protein
VNQSAVADDALDETQDRGLVADAMIELIAHDEKGTQGEGPAPRGEPCRPYNGRRFKGAKLWQDSISSSSNPDNGSTTSYAGR